ncbi:MAG: glycoside hydrolase family 43 protein, partial [Chitinophagaceae bacterium]
MKKRLYTLALLLCALTSTAQQHGSYVNPVLAGFYPDPSICRVGGDYYLVTSSFAYFPGLPLFHSRDLVNWRQIGHAMDRPSQLPLNGAGVSRGLFAPTIRHHNGRFYIVCTLIDKGGNFVITAERPEGPWSDPVWLKNVDGIDPSLFFDEDNGSAYILYNSEAPGRQPRWDGHRTIRMRSFDPARLQAGGEELLLVNGGVDTTKKPVWIEAPHIYKVGEWYYLLCAEGGTAYNHSEVVFRSRSARGPYAPFAGNPILTQRHLDPARPHPITTAGHADLVQTPEGSWYAVFLGCRPYQGNHFNTGRETFLAPVRWENRWPLITKDTETVRYRYPLPLPLAATRPHTPFGGNFSFHDAFDGPKLQARYAFLRTPLRTWHRLENGRLSLQARAETVGGTGNPSFVGHRQQHLQCTASTIVDFKAAGAHEKAGLIIFQNEEHYYFLCRSVEQGRPVAQLYRSAPGDSMELLRTQQLRAPHRPTGLRIEARGSAYIFSITDGGRRTVLGSLDASFLSTETAGGFVGSLFGLYATAQG